MMDRKELAGELVKLAKDLVGARRISTETVYFVSGTEVAVQVKNAYKGACKIDDVIEGNKETTKQVDRIGVALEKAVADAGIEFYDSGQGETWITGMPNYPSNIMIDSSYSFDFFGLMENIPAMVELLEKRGIREG
jgi:hypothetical protein